MVAGFDRPSAGRVLVNGAPVEAPHPSRAVVFQEAALFPWYTVWDNVSFGPRTMGIPAAHYRPKVEAYLEQVGLTRLRAPLPGRAVGRDEAAGGHRAGAGHGARGAADGRALRQPGRPDAVGDAGAAARGVGAAPPDRALHHPRHRGGAAAGRQRLRHDGAARPDQAAPAGRPAAPALAGGHHLARLQRAEARGARADPRGEPAGGRRGRVDSRV